MEAGHLLVPIALPEGFRNHVLARDWAALDRAVAAEVAPGGVIHAEMRRHATFASIEHIISIRSSFETEDEDGIWHDDGSRVLAFSLSLTLAPEGVRGGRLELRRRQETERVIAQIPTPPYGTMIVFQTGQGGYEHRIRAVTAGERIIVAGWAT